MVELMTVLKRLRLDTEFLKDVLFSYNRYLQLKKELEELQNKLKKYSEDLPDVLSRVESVKEHLKLYIDSLPDEAIKEKGGGIISIINTIREIAVPTPECERKLSYVMVYVSEYPEKVDPNEARRLLKETIDSCINPLIEEVKKIEDKIKTI